MKLIPICTALLLGSATLHSQDLQQAPKETPPKTVDQALKLTDIYKSVVRIEVATQVPDYRTPWNAGRFGGGTGTGFLIGKNKFLTNAHVVSDARRILITMHGSSRKHPAKVLHIAHDCDLALLEVEDFAPFDTLPFLPIGNVPALESQVRVIGYPVGGERISVTRGVVSRIDFRPYSHSRADSHLVVQIDAAINPGNSGGPVLQEGKVAGVAFQGLTSADNTGYMIPTPVVNRFLTDIEDGKYNHYVDIGISEFSLFNPAMRKVYNLGPDAPGVLVTDVVQGGSADGILQKGDILTAIDNNVVDSSGNVMFSGERVNMNEIVERKFAGDQVALTIIRDGQKQEMNITLKSFAPSRMLAVQYDKSPRYTIQGGLVFQPLDINLYSAHKLNNPRVRHLFSNYLKEGLYKKRKDIVILTTVLGDPVNSSLSSFKGNAVSSINDIPVRDLNHAHELLNPTTMPEFFVIKLDGLDRPIILPSEELTEANNRIKSAYSIAKQNNLEE